MIPDCAVGGLELEGTIVSRYRPFIAFQFFQGHPTADPGIDIIGLGRKNFIVLGDRRFILPRGKQVICLLGVILWGHEQLWLTGFEDVELLGECVQSPLHIRDEGVSDELGCDLREFLHNFRFFSLCTLLKHVQLSRNFRFQSFQIFNYSRFLTLCTGLQIG